MSVAQDSSNKNVLQAFLNTALTEIMALVKAECGSVFLFDPDNKELVLDSVHNSPTLSPGLRQKVGEGIAGKVMSMGTPVLVKNINSDGRFQSNSFNHYHTPSFLSIPLSGTEGVLGVINLSDKSTGEPFDEKDFDAAVAMGHSVYRIAYDIMRISLLRQENMRLQHQLAINQQYTSVGKLTCELLHQINSPLDGTIRYTNLLLSTNGLDDTSRAYLENVKKGLDRITNITRSVLDFCRMCGTPQMVETRRVQIHDLIEDALDTVKYRLAPSITVTTRFAEKLRPLRDYGLQHALMNLLTNALDAMPAGGELCITTREREGHAEIIFRDTGTGIPEHLHGKIFEPFFTTKEPGRGTGLGLAITQEVIHKYGGRIALESAPGSGSTFTLTIPLHD